MQSNILLTLTDGVRIAVSDSLRALTTYVLREQGDWFEDEIKFLRRVLEPGQCAIDIGANHGVYALSMARRVDPGGFVWAFEPGSWAAEHLAASIAENRFTHVSLEKKALSDRAGTATLALHAHSEGNKLGGPGDDNTETVEVARLDDYLDVVGDREIAFVKLDAEGEEPNILRGAARFLAAQSPLIQFEVKEGENLNLALVDQFEAQGYRPYRLVPGLDLLVPFDRDEPIDRYLLNLFCCKPDRAAELERRGLLVVDVPAPEPDADDEWLAKLGALPYGRVMANRWADGGPSSRELGAALSAFLKAGDPSATSAQRYAALADSYHRFQALCATAPGHLRRSSLARVARSYGARGVAVDALVELYNGMARDRAVDFSEPFLAPVARFDSIEPGTTAVNWMLAATIEGIELYATYSSFYDAQAARERLETIRRLGFASEEILRRLDLAAQRAAELPE